MDVSDRDLIVKMAEGLWDEVVNANSCLLLLLYYREALCTGFSIIALRRFIRLFNVL